MTRTDYKTRRICYDPGDVTLTPGSVDEDCPEIVMSIDEFETIRLIDLEGLSQTECADMMGIARTTAQTIYNSARKKQAMALVYKVRLKVEGGNVRCCDGNNSVCQRCMKNDQIEDHQLVIREENITMRIAVTYENGKVFQHFGRSESFKLYDVENNEVVSANVVGTNGKGHGALAGVLQENKVDVLICGGIGGGAQNALKEKGIELMAGQSGDTDEVVSKYLLGELVNSGSNCDHHHHGEGHSCGEHGCH